MTGWACFSATGQGELFLNRKNVYTTFTFLRQSYSSGEIRWGLRGESDDHMQAGRKGYITGRADCSGGIMQRKQTTVEDGNDAC
jgi:hypothetical protein